MKAEQYIEHEVQIRVLKEVNETRFVSLENTVNQIDSKVNWIMGLVLSSILLPVGLHHVGLI